MAKKNKKGITRFFGIFSIHIRNHKSCYLTNLKNPKSLPYSKSHHFSHHYSPLSHHKVTIFFDVFKFNQKYITI